MSLHPRIASTLIIDRGAWRYPFQQSLRWGKNGWATFPKAGLVNADDVTIAMAAETAPPATLAALRAKGTEAKGTIDCPLSDGAALALGNWRAIGPDATPSGVTAGSSVAYETVPLFFSVRGVGPAPKTTAADGLLTTMANPTADPNTRLLRAMEIVLYKDLTIYTDHDGNGNAITRSNPSAKPRAYLRALSQYDPTAPASGAATTNVALWMATVYLMSPAGAAYQSSPDASWQPFAQHYVSWNLGFGVNHPVYFQPQALTLLTGLAGGTGDIIDAAILGTYNAGDAQSAADLSPSIQGAFWTC